MIRTFEVPQHSGKCHERDFLVPKEVEAFVVLLTEGLIFCAEYNSRSRSIFVGWTHVNFKTGQCEPK